MHTVDPHRITEGEWIAVVDGNGKTQKLFFDLDR
jgi:hypothetical protein